MSKSHVKEGLMSAILAEPWTKEHFLKLIDHLRNAREEEELQSFREMYSQRFLPSCEFWRMWFADMVQLSTEDEVHAFFSHAYEMCPDVDLASDYLAYVEKCVEDNNMAPETFRVLLEPVLSTAGIDLITGPELWTRYRAMEVDEFEDLLDAKTGKHSAEDMTKHKIYIIRNVFTRQLGIPLMGNEIVLKELEAFLGDYCDNSDVDQIRPDLIKLHFESAIEKREKVVDFEEKLLSADDSESETVESKIRLWQEYIRFESELPDVFRAIRLQERAILSIGKTTSPRKLFEDYVDFCVNTKDWKLLSAVTKRGTIVAYDSTFMWKLRLLSIEISGQSEDSFLASHQLCLNSGFSSPTEYVQMLVLKCDYYRRQVMSRTASNELKICDAELWITKLRESFDSAESFMTQYYPTWLEGWAQILRYRVTIEDNLVAEIGERLSEENEMSSSNLLSSLSPNVWEKFMSRFGKTCGASMWKDYVKWALTITQDLDSCRQILKKGIALLASDSLSQEELCLESIRFEEQHGHSALDAVAVISKAKTKLSAILQTRAESLKAAEFSSISEIASAVPPKVTNLKVPKVDRAEKKSLKRSREVNDDFDKSTEKKLKEANIAEVGDTISVAMEVDSSEISAVSKSIFIKNVSFAATEEEISTLCSSCGDIERIEFLKSDNGKFKGMVHVDYKSAEVATKAVEIMNGHPIHNRNLTVELYHETAPAKKKSIQAVTEDGTKKWHPTTVFISKLPRAYTDDDVKKYFEAFGPVKTARVLLDKYTGETKCRALIEFESAESVAQALECKHTIDGIVANVTRSYFPADAPATVNNGGVTNKSQLPPVKTTNTPVVNPKKGSTAALLGFKPRVLKRKSTLDTGVDK